jgi:hypothetical protein
MLLHERFVARPLTAPPLEPTRMVVDGEVVPFEPAAVAGSV